MKPIYINGRYLAQRTTGVQRFASELVCALDDQMLSGALEADTPVFLVLPHGRFLVPPLKKIQIIQNAKLKGHAWEQLELPIVAKSGVLFNPCGPAPIFHSHQITALHDASIHVAPAGYSWKFRMWHKLLMWRSSRNARLVVTVSEFSKRQLIDICKIPEQRIQVIYQSGNHILRNPLDLTILSKHGLDKSEPYVLCVGSQQANKNFSAVAQASLLLQDENVRFVVVGATDSSIYQNPILKHKRMIFTGYITDRELRSLYQHAACFVFPSLYEGYGIPPLEAMACGCPVIASNTSSIPEACGSAVLYFDPRRPDILSERLRDVLTDPKLREELKERGLRHARTKTWEDASMKLFKLLWTIASSDKKS